MEGHVVVMGAGSWGTALALALSHQHSVVLWSRSPGHVQELLQTRENLRYLPGVVLPQELQVTDNIQPFFSQAQLILIAVPMSALHGLLTVLHKECTHDIPIIATGKGFDPITQLTGSGVYRQFWGNLRGFFSLSGPTFAREVALGQPCAMVLASEAEQFQNYPYLLQNLSCPHWRLFISHDLSGVELGGALKNILAIAVGICDGLKLGLNARAALLCLGLAEMNMFVQAVGGSAETVFSFSGLGDLVLTSTGILSRNRQVGLALAEGKQLQDVLAQLGQTAEGVLAVQVLMTWKERYQVSLPIFEGVYAILYEQAPLSRITSCLFPSSD